jgi:hypothetical protein
LVTQFNAGIFSRLFFFTSCEVFYTGCNSRIPCNLSKWKVNMGSILIVGVAAVAIASTGAAYGGSFDGTYRGVWQTGKLIDNTFVQGGRVTCQPDHVPPPLIVSNGAVTLRGFEGHVTWQGNIDPAGNFTIRSSLSQRMDGHIDEQGVARGQMLNPSCYFVYTWRKA